MPKLVVIFTLAALVTVPATAETAIPDLRGTWTGESEAIVWGAPIPIMAPSVGPSLGCPRLRSR